MPAGAVAERIRASGDGTIAAGPARNASAPGSAGSACSARSRIVRSVSAVVLVEVTMAEIRQIAHFALGSVV